MVYNEDYTRKVLPFLKESYFQDTLERILFEHVKDHLEKYNKSPTVESLSIGISDRTDLSEELLENVYKILGKIKSDKDFDNVRIVLKKKFNQGGKVSSGLAHVLGV